jgi:glyoxylase-like metal-dependent hydrolase (beta-lactamase superfamily II)
MNHLSVKDIGNDIYEIALIDAAETGRSTGFLINSKEKTIVEVGASVSVPRILQALDDLNIPYEEIRYVIVTHIHLDHSGGAGLLLNYLPNAKIIVHPKGARHLIDPSKLIASAQQVYGESFEPLFAPIEAIPEERVIIAEDGMSLNIGEERPLVFYHSPGHAYHHIIIHDPKSKGLFSGDAFGINFPLFEEMGVRYVVPTSSPTQFNPEAMADTIEKVKPLGIENIFFTHFGAWDNAEQVIERMLNLIPIYVELAEKGYKNNPTWESIASELRAYYHTELKEFGVPENHPYLTSLELDTELNAKGLLHYLETKN